MCNSDALFSSRWICWVLTYDPKYTRQFATNFSPPPHWKNDMFSRVKKFRIQHNDTMGLCVLPKLGWIVVSCYATCEILAYSVTTGSRVRSIGTEGNGQGQFLLGHGGLCASPDGEGVLVAERYNNRVQQIRMTDLSWVRFVGKGVLEEPDHVDCNTDVIVVSEGYSNRISVLSWSNGGLRAQFGDDRCAYNRFHPAGIRLTADGVLVADEAGGRVWVFGLHGEFAETVCDDDRGLERPRDVLDCAEEDGGLLALDDRRCLKRFDRRGAVWRKFDTWDGEDILDPVALAQLPGGEIVVRSNRMRSIIVLRYSQLRFDWLCVCVATAHAT